MTEPVKVLENQYPPEIPGAINAIMGEVNYIQKKGTNTFHNYKFAAVGDLLAKLQPAMAKAGLIVMQNEMAHTLSGAVMEVKYEFTLIHKSGAVWPDRPVHTGMATATNSKGGFDDKCVNKCMTAARKYFLLALFQIPTGDLPDADEEEDKPVTKGANEEEDKPVTKGANGNGQARTATPQHNADEPWKKDAERIKQGIKAHTELMPLEAFLKQEEKTLATIKENSPSAHDFLVKGADAARAVLKKAA